MNNYSKLIPPAKEDPRIAELLYAVQIKATLQRFPCPSDPPCDLVFCVFQKMNGFTAPSQNRS